MNKRLRFDNDAAKRSRLASLAETGSGIAFAAFRQDSAAKSFDPDRNR